MLHFFKNIKLLTLIIMANFENCSMTARSQQEDQSYVFQYLCANATMKTVDGGHRLSRVSL